jgi:hypothetical protein
MSYDKSTSNLSHLDNTKALLKKLKVPFKETIIGTVTGRGNNDEGDWYIRRLEYSTLDKTQTYVILEQMWRTEDCDSDDMLTSTEFEKDKVPNTWPLEINIDEPEEIGEVGLPDGTPIS